MNLLEMFSWPFMQRALIAGVLVSLLTVFYQAGANILTVNQNIPVKGRAFVSVSARVDKMERTPGELLEQLKRVEGVVKIDSIVD